jgi:hypothetical protein
MDTNQHSIRVSDEAWAALTALAEAHGHTYRGRPSQGKVIEELVRGAVPAQPAAAATQQRAYGDPVSWPVPDPQPAPSFAAGPQPAYRLADIVARWPEKTQAQWRAEEWKAGRWVKLVVDTINGQG